MENELKVGTCIKNVKYDYIAEIMGVFPFKGSITMYTAKIIYTRFENKALIGMNISFDNKDLGVIYKTDPTAHILYSK